MGQGVSEVLPFAVGVAISPIPIIGVILMLLSSRARVNGPVFALGWVAALGILSAAVYGVSDAIGVEGDSAGSDGVSWVQIALGLVLLGIAARRWRKRPPPGVEPPLPRWMAGIETIAPGTALGLAFALSVLNPKNLALTVGAAAGLAQLDIATSEAIGSLVVFVVLASSTVGGAVVYYLAAGESAERALGELREWLAPHSAVVMVVLFLVFGAVLVAKGLEPLTD